MIRTCSTVYCGYLSRMFPGKRGRSPVMGPINPRGTGKEHSFLETPPKRKQKFLSVQQSRRKGSQTPFFPRCSLSRTFSLRADLGKEKGWLEPGGRISFLLPLPPSADTRGFGPRRRVESSARGSPRRRRRSAEAEAEGGRGGGRRRMRKGRGEGGQAQGPTAPREGEDPEKKGSCFLATVEE